MVSLFKEGEGLGCRFIHGHLDMLQEIVVQEVVENAIAWRLTLNGLVFCLVIFSFRGEGEMSFIFKCIWLGQSRRFIQLK